MAERIPWRRRVPWWAVIVTGLVVVTAAVAVDPIRNAVTLGPVGEARLDPSPAYLSIAPLSNLLDTITLLTVGQHIAVGVWAIGVFVLVRVVRARRTEGTTIRRETIAAAAFLFGILATYSLAALAPRPMAALATSDLSVIAVDFHAHTMYSHDGRPGWTDADVRNWYRGAGFDAAYITDHRTVEGAERGIASNPGQAGEGTTLLQGLEAFYRGEHVNALSAGRRFHGLTSPDLKDLDERSLALANMITATSPVLIETMPGNLDKVPTLSPAGAPGVMAIEIVDGSPRGLSQTRAQRERIIHIADSLNLALVTGSDNHGWGRTAPGWTLFRIGGWRGMTTDSLSGRIEDVLRKGRREATLPVERRVAGATNPIALVFAAPLIVWRMFTTLGPDERVMWLVWTWGVVFLVRGLRRYRIRPSATT